MKHFAILTIPVLLASCSDVSTPVSPHLAPVSWGAIPEVIGCEGAGCESMNIFAHWQPLLTPLVEMQRKQEKCGMVRSAMIDFRSDPADPKFDVMCKDATNGQLYSTSYTLAQVESDNPSTSKLVLRARAQSACTGQLTEKLPESIVFEQHVFDGPNGSLRIEYDLVESGIEKEAVCLYSQQAVKFNVVQ